MDARSRTGGSGEQEAPGARLEFAMQFTSSPRGARLARRLAEDRLARWGYGPGSEVSETVRLLVAELTANAVRHGTVPGRDFRLRVALDGEAGLVRIEVADSRARLPRRVGPSGEEEGGRGLLLVEALARRWGVEPRSPVGKTVWAEVAVEPPTSPGKGQVGPRTLSGSARAVAL
ncbi:ATP-binding protein [Streptomyces sp. NPDC090306]|uniref:ATP-binding protein n=1 Tax=Streptomyces sp. NPDC090306 TaxID=3365961 RepID=UPI00381925E8